MAEAKQTALESAEERLRTILRSISTMQAEQEHLEYELAHLVHDLGLSWARIGEAHEPPISRERATKRYSHPKPRRASRQPS